MRPLLCCLGALLIAAVSCRGANPEMGLVAVPRVGGDPLRGRETIERFDCGRCHTVPGVAGAHGLVAPPLMWFSRRTYVAGILPNTPDNLVRWIRDPQGVEPRAAMPNVGLTEQQARDVAAYLYTLR